MPLERHVYLLDPQKLSPEAIAVTFAKTSRSPSSFQRIAADLTDERSAKFHKKWGLDYGHASVAEHAILHIAIENISRLAIETLEANRLASYTEKSTRYQKWDLEDFFIPTELAKNPLKSIYLQTCHQLFDTYQKALPILKAAVIAKNPRLADESQPVWERRIRSKYIDVSRYLLPAASLANVGVSINTRALEHALRKMFSHPLSEVRSLGADIQQAAIIKVPTLLKHINPVRYLKKTRESLCKEADRIPTQDKKQQDWCRLVGFDTLGEERILAAALYRFGDIDYKQSFEYILGIPKEERQRLTQILLGKLDRHDIPLRELEHTTYMFDVVLDQGAYFELKRHRMMTQTPQALTTSLGYTIPRLIVSAGLKKTYQEVMESVQKTYEQLACFNSDVASYIVPNAFNRRVLVTLNLRSADHFLNLRTSKNAHFSIRRVAYRMAEQIKECTPLLGSYLRIQPAETWQEIESQHFSKI